MPDDVTGAVIDLAVKAGETAATVETIQEDQAETTKKLEDQENVLQWTQDDVSNLYRRIGELEDRVNTLELAPVIEEVIEEEPAPAPVEPAPNETIIAEPEQKKEKKKVKSWGLF
jgi:predicted nuclease with TOPRIM domain